MEKLNEYLSILLSSCSDELRLEPERNPYLVSANRTTDLGNTPMLGTQISMMIFPLIPANVKASLPHNDEVEFVLPHNLGQFKFVVQKSPTGFNVTIRPVLSDSSSTPITRLPPQPPVRSTPQTETGNSFENLAPKPMFTSAASSERPEYVFESASSGLEYSSSLPSLPSLEELLIESPAMAAEYDASATSSSIEVISANDPSFQTVFSDTSDYEPPGRRGDFDNAAFSHNAEPEYVIPVEPSAPSVEFPNAQPTFTPLAAEVAQPQMLQPQMLQQHMLQQQMLQQQPQAAWPPPLPPVENSFVAESSDPAMQAQMDDLFRQMAEIGASDLHLSVSVPPMIRRDGKMCLLADGVQALTPQTMRSLLTSIMPAKNQEEFEVRNDTDFAYEIPGLARFRCNVFMDRKGMGAVFRIIPTKILTAEQLSLSKAIMGLTTLSKGLVVVTGPTGSGKSTTLCAMVDSLNKTREDHIITIEDPIEFVHDNHKCLVNQREVHNHTDSFKDALRAALREDPDILLVGEMRDLETISIAIETAETGHLVFGTLHTTTAASTVDRIIDQFPADRQQQIRVMLSESLKGVIAQTLLPKKGGGRVAALEVLIVTPAISNLIREGKTFQIPSAMQTGRTHGMVMLNDALYAHVESGAVEPRDAYVKAVDKTGFEQLLTRGGFKL